MTTAAPPEKMSDAELAEHIRTTTEKLCFEFCEMKPCACAEHLAALSAPPAASADERDDLLQFIYGWVQPEMTVPITDALIKAGYRKRAAGGEG